MQARYVQERRRTVSAGAPHSHLLLEKPSLLLHPTPGADAPNTELVVSEGGQFEQKVAEKAHKAKKIAGMRRRKLGIDHLLYSYSMVAPATAPLAEYGYLKRGTGRAAPFAGGHADLQFAGPAVVLPDVHVREDGAIHVPNEKLPDDWHSCAALF